MTNKDLTILQNFNVLYLEDDEDLLKHTKDILVDFVNNIYAVKTSKEAMDILLHKKIDVIICDILLKDENGIDFLKHIKNKNINTPIILTTAHTDTQYLLDAIKLKVENYIVKPIDVKELLNNLHDILLPIVQKKEIQKNNNVIKTISAITDGKQVAIIKYIINNLDNENLFSASYTDIMDEFTISKPTLIKLFKELAEKNILVKIQHKTYRFNEQALESL
ncbi:MAG: response regulator transcription factor [Aliarcobacter sp.]|nr:response regulator transcription factor [Aliarcobacter sp.]